MLCKIGDVEIWRILEINGPFRSPEELFPSGGPEVGRIISELVPDQICASTGKLILPIQGFLLKTPSHVILVDSCVGNDKTVPGNPDWHKRSNTRFLSALKAAGVSPQDIDYVLCTHLHTDHVGWNTRLDNGRWVPTFPNARYLVPEADEAFHRKENGNLYRESVLPVIECGQAEFVTDGHRLGDHVELVSTPGHTPGHVSVLIRSGTLEALITGDAIHTSAQCSHPDWHFKYDADGEMAAKSRRRLLENASQRNCRVIGSHFLLPSIGRVHAHKDAFRWEDD